jgi:hypothetical protein
MRQYVQQYVTEYPELLDLVAHDGFNTTLSATAAGGGIAQQPTLMYPIHLPMSEVLNGMKVGRYHRGIVRCQQRDTPFDCYVMLRSADKSADGASKYVLIQGKTFFLLLEHGIIAVVVVVVVVVVVAVVVEVVLILTSNQQETLLDCMLYR